MNIALDDKRLQYCGRIDWSDDRKPEFIFPASYVKFRYFGTWAKLRIYNWCLCWDNYVGAIVDGEQKVWKLNGNGYTDIKLCEADDVPREHEILFFKRMDACHQFQLVSLELAEKSVLLEQEAPSQRRIEVYGDSVSAGEVSEAVVYVGKTDPEHMGEYSNSWYSYAWMLARKLHAQLHDIAQGGIPLLNGDGWVGPFYPGMEFMWDKLHYRKELEEPIEWDFQRYTPQVVIVAIGQNDSHPQDYMKDDFYCEKAVYWRIRYQEFIQNLRQKYPDAHIICCTTLLMHDASWDSAIDLVCQELEDDRVHHYVFQRNGAGTPGHLRIPEAEEMAQELAVYIEKLSVFSR